MKLSFIKYLNWLVEYLEHLMNDPLMIISY